MVVGRGAGRLAGAVAQVRVAVRRDLGDLAAGSLVLVGCSGGADSVALAAALAFVAPRLSLAAGLVTVDHAWAAGSDERARAVAALGHRLGLEPVDILTAPSARSEGAARDVRRAALLAAAERHGASAVLLAHTLDDQAETVLMRLARGSGARSLAGMPRRDGLVRRPLLDVRRATTRAACLAGGLEVWDDPTNADPAFTRARVRHRILPALEDELGPGIALALARTADLLRDDADALDADAGIALAAARDGADTLAETLALRVAVLAGLRPAVRGRVLRDAALAAGCPPTALNAGHVRAVDALVTDWHGQRAVALPGGVTARRRHGIVILGRDGAGSSAGTAPGGA